MIGKFSSYVAETLLKDQVIGRILSRIRIGYIDWGYGLTLGALVADFNY